MKNVKFNCAGKWATLNPKEPQFEVTEGEEKELDDNLAMAIVESGKGEIVGAKSNAGPDSEATLTAEPEKEEEKTTEAEEVAPPKNKSKGKGGGKKTPATKDKGKAEFK